MGADGGCVELESEEVPMGRQYALLESKVGERIIYYSNAYRVNKNRKEE